MVDAAGSVALAADEVREKALIAASALMGVDAAELEIIEGRVSARQDTEQSMALGDVAKAFYYAPGAPLLLPDLVNPNLEATATLTSPHIQWMPDEMGRVKMYPAHVTGAEAAVIDVDIETGAVTVEKIWIVGDVGVVIHPGALEGQVVGGTIQASVARCSSITATTTRGIRSTTLRDYGFPTIRSVPPVDVIHLENPSPTTPLGARGAGEGGQVATYSAIMSAIEDALRPIGTVEVDSLPLAPSRLWT